MAEQRVSVHPQRCGAVREQAGVGPARRRCRAPQGSIAPGAGKGMSGLIFFASACQL